MTAAMSGLLLALVDNHGNQLRGGYFSGPDFMVPLQPGGPQVDQWAVVHGQRFTSQLAKRAWSLGHIEPVDADGTAFRISDAGAQALVCD
jgi:hypothetical protein